MTERQEPRTEAGGRLLAALMGDVHDARDALDAILAIEQEAGGAVGEREELARALVDSGLIARFSDYALRAHPTTMQREDPLDIARGWAADILARLSVNEGGPTDDR